MEYRAPHPMMNVGGAPYYPHPGVSANKIAKRTELAPNKGGPFAAALRTLAKNAGPDVKDGAAPPSAEREVNKDKPPPAPPKRASPHHLPASGFQPYRPDDRLAHPAAASFPLLEPAAYSPYAHPSIYSSAALQYRLAAEEQMYLERVFRGGVGMGVGWLPPYALYPPLAPPLPLVPHPHAHPHPHPAAHAHPHAQPHHAVHDDREKEIALQRERERERERELRDREQREKEQRERAAREKESRARDALAAAALHAPHSLPYGLPRSVPPLLYRPYRPYAYEEEEERARSSKPSQPVASTEEDNISATLEPSVTSNTPIAKPPEPPKPEEPPPFIDKTNYVPPKPISHSPKISPSSIPNPNPSVTTTKQVESGYSNYGGYLYSVPGYSAFQPVAYPGKVRPTTTCQKETSNSEFVVFPPCTKETATTVSEEKSMDLETTEKQSQSVAPKAQTDFEEKFTPEIIPASPTSESNKNSISEPKINITQSSGATVPVPTQISIKEIKKKPPERFSLKTSIPISKIDMKCVGNPPDSVLPNHLPKKPFNPAFHNPNMKENGSKIEIQSNIVIKSALKEPDVKEIAIKATPSNSINTLINAAEAINKNESQFKKPDPKPDQSNEVKESSFKAPAVKVQARPIFNPINIETSTASVTTKPSDSSPDETKNQIVFIQKNNPSNPKMLLTIQQQNPHVLLQRTEFNPKNLQAPSRQSSQITKKCKEELVNENGTSSKVVSLKRMHQDNCDENDFENLITENQIYGNKIVVKEKSQGTLQEQDLKNKVKITDKPNPNESKNVVLQPNFVYLSNVQFPTNLMMIKNNGKVNADSNKHKLMSNENKLKETSSTNLSNDLKSKSNDVSTNKEIHVLKTNNNVLQTLTNNNNNNKSDLVFQTSNQKVIMNPQIVYQLPMLIDSDNKLNQSFVKGEYVKLMGQNKKELEKSFDQVKTNDKLFITCPYQMDSKLQPKIVITNIRPKISKIEEVSSLDVYEQRKKLRRLKYLSNRDVKNTSNYESQKTEPKKVQDFTKNVITPEKMRAEIYKEFANTKLIIHEECNDSDSDYGEEDLQIYNSLIAEYGDSEKKNELKQNEQKKIEFLGHLKLASHNEFNERNLLLQEKILRTDAVACAYIAAGRIDCLLKEENVCESFKSSDPKIYQNIVEKDDDADEQLKRKFLVNLKLKKVTPQQKQDYEKVWQEIEKERKRRELPTETGQILQQSTLQSNFGELDTKGQLNILTEIKKHVNENNILIKRRLDSQGDEGESIRVLAEKNFSELNRLSKMADRSVKHFSGPNTRKRDLNPGFDSENIQKCVKSGKYYPNINIPNISKIISLKSTQTSSIVASTQATSMDEPQNSASGVSEMFCDNLEKVQDFSCQADVLSSWPGIEVIMKTYKDYESARKKEIIDLQKRNTSLRVESAHITRAASRDSDRARALLAERRNLANEERNVRNSIQWLYTIIDLVRNYDVK